MFLIKELRVINVLQILNLLSAFTKDDTIKKVFIV